MEAGGHAAGASLSTKADAVRLAPGVWVYFGTLTIAGAFGDPTGLLTLPILFTLKDRLGLGPQSLALFETMTFIPVYLGFAFGFLRDRWRPFGLGDRGYLLLGAPVAICCYAWLAVGKLSYWPLLAAIVLAMVAYQLIDVVSDSLLTAVAQRHLMTGRLSAAVEGAEAVPGILAVVAGGWMAVETSLSMPLTIAAVCSIAILGHVWWYPRETFAADPPRCRETHRAAIARLWHHRPLRVALIVAGTWNLSLAWGTPYLFYFSDELRLSSEVFGVYRAAGLACAVVAAPAYGFLCQRVTLKRLLRISLVASVPPGFLYLVVSDVPQVLVVAVLAGLPTAFGYMALFDLLRRACPRDLEGTAMMLLSSALAVAAGTGDLVGAWIYAHGGFAGSLVADTIANAAVLPLLILLPADLVSRRDGESVVATA